MHACTPLYLVPITRVCTLDLLPTSVHRTPYIPLSSLLSLSLYENRTRNTEPVLLSKNDKGKKEKELRTFGRMNEPRLTYDDDK